ncbi:phenylacetate-CoA oxygenase subunit PaaC [Kaustia mangrovi]|uniref:Phenylacetate-CoA oxygenase subunit PaaC n=1 Tax=Kaustia mangrovi TaxID=2593653 RepID=A0A7S8HD75_9HYPH|nr:1,2-phenylacetyl-CoA epoxidase subunit PaaC [Kaustia mangrovi]QPC44189.1 phenylacetate-CoA oxygenase subunit PaaC [Kaustia mangrovi]
MAIPKDKALFDYAVRLADDQLVLGHRLSEWCGRAPTLEEELALANMGLDLIGQARSLYTYAGEVEGEGRDEDALAYLRSEREFANMLLVEQPNDDFAHTMVRQLFHAAFMTPYWEAMTGSADATLSGIAGKAVKEARYHLRHSAEWIVRLGDGTEESHARTRAALDHLWVFTGELFEMDETALSLLDRGVAVDARALKPEWDRAMNETLARAGLDRPGEIAMLSGGRTGRHSEHLGHLLAEMQYMQRAYPGMTW